MKKFKIIGLAAAAVIALALLTLVSAGTAYASEDAAEDGEQVTLAETEAITSETGDIHYTTGGSAVGRESGNGAEAESVSTILGVRDYIVPSFKSLCVGQSKTLQLSVGTTSTLTWTSSNDEVAMVDAGGNVTGISKGFAVIRATDVSGNYDSVKVFVGYYVGVDLSSHNGEIGNSISTSGIDFAILRRGYGNLVFTDQLDTQFENTYRILKQANIPVGVYLFNYFESTANAVEEAESLYSYIKDLDLELGVYSDFEEGDGSSSYNYYKSVNGRYPTPAEITEMNTAFLETLKSKLDEETPVGYYSSMSQYVNWYSDEFVSTYPLWAAYWAYETNNINEDGYGGFTVLFDKVQENFNNSWYSSYFPEGFLMHQYTCTELARRVDGDYWATLDMDVIDMDSPLALRFVEVEASAKTIETTTTISWSKPEGANTIDGYIVYKTVSGVTSELARVDSDIYSYVEENSQAGNQYYVKAYAVCGDTVYYSQGGGAVEKVFSDVSVSDWFYDDVMYIYTQKIMTGMGDTGKFATSESLNRAQFAVTLWRMAGSPSVTYREVFPDVPENEWYTDAVLWAYENGIISGYKDGCFGPADDITREQLCTMLYRYAKWNGDDVSQTADLSRFADNAEISSWARNGLSWCVAKGIIKGEGNGEYVNPTGNAMRCACAAILKRYIVSQ